MTHWLDRRTRERRKWWLTLLACAGMLTGSFFTCWWVMGCVKVERVQVGPDSWQDTYFERPATSKPIVDQDLATSQPASIPSDIQTPQEIIDELFGDFESYR